MSKRRKKHMETKAEKAEETKHEVHASHPVSHKISEKKSRCCFGGTPAMFYGSLVVVAVIFFAAGLFVGPMMGGSAVSANGDQFIFISPPGCTDCAALEPLSNEVADTLGIPFVKTGFGQQIETPGIVLIHDNILTITGISDEYSLKAQICSITDNTEICDEADKLVPPEEQLPEVPKSDKPEVHAFVMSYCPYGLQFMKAYVPVMELLGDKADLELNFVNYAMHGQKEIDENTRMYCIQKEQTDKFTDYLRCFVEAGDNEGCIDTVGIDSDKLDACISAADEEFKITENVAASTGSYPPYAVDEALALQYSVQGSPTFGINGQQVSVNRSPEAIKQAICAAFNNPPAECSQTLSSASEAPGLGPMGSGGGSDTAAQC
jgi:protein-disulfide isomerase